MNASFDQGRDLQCHRRPQRRRCCRQHSGAEAETPDLAGSEGEGRGRSVWVFIHSFIHDGQKSMSDIPLHAARGKKVGELSGYEETMEVKQVT